MIQCERSSLSLHSVPCAISIRSICILIVLLLHQPACYSQEEPMEGATEFDYNTNTSYRTDVCGRHRDVYGGEIELRDALSGLELSVFMPNYANTSDSIMFQLIDGKIPESDPGLFVVILDELAKRANFSWRNNFGTFKGTGINNKTWTDLLKWSTDTYDISADYWARTDERRLLGISFLEGFYDNSMIIVSKTKRNLSFFNFLNPFQWTVWIVIGSTIITTGAAYFILVRLDENADERQLDTFGAVFLTALTFTGTNAFQPKSHATRLVSFSLSLWVLIIASAYTANMASELLTQDAPSFPYNALRDPVVAKKSICIHANSSHHEEFKRIFKEYPELNNPKKVIPIETNGDEIFDAIHNGSCHVGIVSKETFDLYQSNNTISNNTISNNNACALDWGRQGPVEYYPGSFATALDTNKSCTSLISHVLNLHLYEMEEDGFLANAWFDVYNRLGDGKSSCEKTPGRGISSIPEEALDMGDLFGIFLLHGICSTIAVILAYCVGRRKRDMALEENSHGDNESKQLLHSSSLWSKKSRIDLFPVGENSDKNVVSSLRS